MEDDQHYLWVATSNGLSKFDQRTKIFQTYTEADGLPSSNFSQNAGYKDSTGKLYFGSLNGLVYFNPKQIKINRNISRMVITGVSLPDRKVIIGGEDGILDENISKANKITFPYTENTFTIEFALLNFIKPGKNHYSYQLEGANSRWVNTDLPFAAFNNRSAGNKGVNNDGVQSKTVALVIEVYPPVWKSWWAYLIYLFIIGVVSFFIIRFFYLRGLLKREENLHQLKLNFFTNISHEIHSHLTLIITPLENLINFSTGHEQWNKSIVNIKQNADRLLKLVGELMDFRKAETQNLPLHLSEQDLIAFLKNIYNSFLEIAERKNINLSFQSDMATSQQYFDPTQLEKVFFNLFSNACKFTQTGEKINVMVFHHANQVEIAISDIGKGIDQATLLTIHYLKKHVLKCFYQ